MIFKVLAANYISIKLETTVLFNFSCVHQLNSFKMPSTVCGPYLDYVNHRNSLCLLYKKSGVLNVHLSICKFDRVIEKIAYLSSFYLNDSNNL